MQVSGVEVDPTQMALELTILSSRARELGGSVCARDNVPKAPHIAFACLEFGVMASVKPLARLFSYLVVDRLRTIVTFT